MFNITVKSSEFSHQLAQELHCSCFHLNPLDMLCIFNLITIKTLTSEAFKRLAVELENATLTGIDIHLFLL